MAFLTVKNFFQCVFKNTNQKIICVSIVFKAESKKKIFGGPKKQFMNLNFKKKFCVCSLFKKEAACQFSPKNINIWAPWNVLKMKNFDVCARAEIQDLDFKKSYLTFGCLTFSVHSKKISTLHPIGGVYVLQNKKKTCTNVTLQYLSVKFFFLTVKISYN